MINLDAHTTISDQEIVDTKATIDLHLLVKILSGYATMREETKELLKKNKVLAVNNEQLCKELQVLYQQIKMLQTELATYHKNQTDKESRKKDQNEFLMKHDPFFWGFFDNRE
nr:hypothetical protein [Brevibacillus laterosporus]